MNTSSGDSFFTAKNFYDEGISKFDPNHCELLIEAGVRRLSQGRGPVYAATRLQRLADICAGVHVLPIEHWNRKPGKSEEAPAPAAKPEKPSRYLLRAVAFAAFGVGWLACLAFMTVIDIARLAL
ncbi:hypothetical protein PQB34_gp65 [Ochrobactrum phage POI1126]|uniref:Uncharacterized protein n=1 Tax=Ochrobactrum phage POI1126 TaxID=1932118 RepID=A0A240F4W4_9CAUD|nr:hypothetical protein [Brucella intermedia]YP_010665206.1 hypothetical protein PQB34_gp65 [Ochrobactrum phage POI1126]APU92993.1 hypothetical protein POI1126_67 [Ochrobactrum phage POI1126]NKB96848.1 hypothetical protein [Brucella intermedia]SUA82037.1 Uncharacterised protein [Brucella intermedia]